MSEQATSDAPSNLRPVWARVLIKIVAAWRLLGAGTCVEFVQCFGGIKPFLGHFLNELEFYRAIIRENLPGLKPETLQALTPQKIHEIMGKLAAQRPPPADQVLCHLTDEQLVDHLPTPILWQAVSAKLEESPDLLRRTLAALGEEDALDSQQTGSGCYRMLQDIGRGHLDRTVLANPEKAGPMVKLAHSVFDRATGDQAERRKAYTLARMFFTTYVAQSDEILLVKHEVLLRIVLTWAQDQGWMSSGAFPVVTGVPSPKNAPDEDPFDELITVKPPPVPTVGNRSLQTLSTAELVKQIEDGLTDFTPTLKLSAVKPDGKP